MIWPRVLRCRVRLLRNALLPHPGRPGSGRRTILGGLLAVVIGTLVGLALGTLFEAIASEGAGTDDAGAALALVLTAALAGMLVFDLHEAVSALLADSDLDLLRRAPIPAPSLFALKLLDALPRTSLLLVVLALPAVFAFHVVYPLPFWAWLLLPLQLVALWLVPLGLGAAAAILLLRFLPARHTRDGLALLSTLTLLLLWLVNSFLVPSLVGTTANPIGPLRDLLRAVPIAYRFSPGLWGAVAVAAAAGGSVAGALRATALLVAAGALALALSAGSAALYLADVQSRLVAGEGGVRTRRRRRVSRPARETPRGFIRAVLGRDLRLLARNWTALGDLVTVAVLWTLLPVLGKSLFATASRSLVRAMLLALTVGLGYEVAARAVPMERQAATWMWLAPVAPLRWVAARLAGAAVVAGTLLAVATGGAAVALSLEPHDALESLCLAAPALGLSLATGLWTGVTFGDREWTNPRAMLTLTGRAVATALLVAQAGAWLALVTVAETHASWLPLGILWWGPAVLAALLVPIPIRAAAARIADTR